ncbi:MAG: transposase, partial [Faecalibacterium sp.]
ASFYFFRIFLVHFFGKGSKSHLGLEVDISARIKPEWTILPKRWIVERTFAWINHSRRLSKDYEITVKSAQAMCMIAAL